jgi:hypothetical protein
VLDNNVDGQGRVGRHRRRAREQVDAPGVIEPDVLLDERPRLWANLEKWLQKLGYLRRAGKPPTTNPHNLGKSKKSKTPNPLGGRRIPTAFKGGFGAISPDLPRL